ncbi:MAG: alkyl sulfatase dimerization domain-containing protein [Pseudomonadota bacterium]
MKQFFVGFAAATITLLVTLGAVGFFWINSSGSDFQRQATEYAAVEKVEVLPDVAEHTKIFEKRFEEPVPGVNVAIGHGLANVVVIDAPDGLIMVDTLESIRAAEALLPWVDQIRARTGKEITDIIYTHNHADHVFGAGVFVNSQSTNPNIWAHDLTQGRVHEVVNVLSPIIFERSMRMFGSYLPDESFSNNGIGPRLLSDDQDGFYFLPPTITIAHSTDVEIAGERVIIRHAPGETPDQLMVYLPERKVLLPADNYYHAFPNLYSIRGTPYRDPRDWVASLDLMRSFNAEVMIPQHSQPIVGADEIDERLRNYRDAIQFVYDATIRMMNQGMSPREIAEQIELPPHLAQTPYLQEFYGRVEWAARSVFTGTLGWFSGDPSELRPVTLRREAELIAELSGGEEALASAAAEAMDRGEYAWALTLGQHLSRLEWQGSDTIRANALRALASQESSSSGRNYFLTSAAEAEGFVLPNTGVANTPSSVINDIPIRNFLAALTVNVRADSLLDTELAYGFDFTDETPITVRIRRGIAFVEDGLSDDRQGTLITTTDVFRGIAIERLSPAKLLVSGEMKLEGSVTTLTEFLAYFEPPI